MQQLKKLSYPGASASGRKNQTLWLTASVPGDPAPASEVRRVSRLARRSALTPDNEQTSPADLGEPQSAQASLDKQTLPSLQLMPRRER
jgi:hypothetical protein